ncbi:hypothetical protein EV401DRAFT_190069 [Pisolithus croceorrhizus]|nr:hypothetical protein EV401DRAFT_190069 [Pisolithus croceorrhizus]
MPSTHGPHTSIPAHHCRPSVSSQLHEGGNARNPDHLIGPARLTICLKATAPNHVYQPSRRWWLVLRGTSDDHWAVSEWIRGGHLHVKRAGPDTQTWRRNPSAMVFVSYTVGGAISECPKLEIRMALAYRYPRLTDVYVVRGRGRNRRSFLGKTDKEISCPILHDSEHLYTLLILRNTRLTRVRRVDSRTMVHPCRDHTEFTDSIR